MVHSTAAEAGPDSQGSGSPSVSPMWAAGTQVLKPSSATSQAGVGGTGGVTYCTFSDRCTHPK